MPDCSLQASLGKELVFTLFGLLLKFSKLFHLFLISFVVALSSFSILCHYLTYSIDILLVTAQGLG
jgi:hypothetical protein